MSDDYHLVRNAAAEISSMYPKAAAKFPEDLFIKVFTLYEMLRIADNIEDSSIRDKKTLFEMHTESLRKVVPDHKLVDILTATVGDDQEASVIRHYHTFFNQFRKLPESTRKTIAQTVENMLPGMQNSKYAHIENFAQQEEYAGYVAGEVGVGLTRIFNEHLHFTGEYNTFMDLAWKTGVFWQKINIIRGVAKDSAQDRFYIPSELMRRYGLDHDAFRDQENNCAAKLEVIDELLADAEHWLQHNVDYLKRIPVAIGQEREYSLGIRTFVAGIALVLADSIKAMHNKPSILFKEYKPSKISAFTVKMFTSVYWNDNERIEKEIRKIFSR